MKPNSTALAVSILSSALLLNTQAATAQTTSPPSATATRPATTPPGQTSMAEAELTVELINTRCAGLLSDAVERRSRKIEMQGVVRLLDDVARIVLEIVQIRRARLDIRLQNALATLPELAVRVIVKFQADDIGILKGQRAGETRHGVIIPGFGGGDFGVAQ